MPLGLSESNTVRLSLPLRVPSSRPLISLAYLLAESIALSITVLVVGHTNCGGAAACLQAVSTGSSPLPPGTPLSRWLAPLTALASRLDLEDVPPSEALTKIVEASVRAQVENVVNSEPVQTAWANGRKNLWVHGIVYELETGRLRDLNITRGPPA
jgi:carbonic anhydrase